LLVTALLAYQHFYSRHPVGKGPAGPAVPRESFQTVWTTQAVLVVGLGDSVTAGFGASKGHSYFKRLIANPPDEFPNLRGVCLPAVLPNLRHTNLSVSGSTSPQHLKAQLPRLPRQPPDVLGVVVLTTGGNDVIHNYGRTPPAEGAMYGATLKQAQPWIANFERRLEAILDGIEQRFPGGGDIFLANIYDPTDGIGDADRADLPAWPDGMKILEAYNRIIAETAAKRPSVHLVDIRDAFLGHGIHCTQFWRRFYRRDDPHYWYHENLEDPNDRGYDALRRQFLNAIADVFYRRNGKPRGGNRP
jgi:lysophospholipase L1-like esterase